jgi:uncharacterized membrane protein YgaE (UPF0421/DUF939 family)
VRKSIERIVGVIIGVSLAVLMAHFLGLNIWTITLIVFSAQIIGMFLQNRGQYLATQIPISAALALLLGTSASDYPFLRMLGALIGGLVGTIISLLLSLPVYIFKARDAIAALTTELADALPKLAQALAVREGEAESRSQYTSIRELEQRVHATEQALSLGIDSARLNPWARRARRLLIGYPDVVLTLDRLVRQMRRIAYTINESDPPWSEIAQKQEWAEDYADLLEEIGHILALAAEYMHSPATKQKDNLPKKEDLSIDMEHARQQLRSAQTQLVHDAKQSEIQIAENVDSSSVSTGYRLATRGAILTDLRRMLDEVQDLVMMTADTSIDKVCILDSHLQDTL